MQELKLGLSITADELTSNRPIYLNALQLKLIVDKINEIIKEINKKTK